MEIDAEQEARRYIGDVKRDIERMFSPNVIRQAHKQIDMAAASPGLAEVALLDRMIDLIVGRAANYDLVVFDTAPTGHTLQLLRMPEAITTWIQALVRHRRALVEIDRGSEQSAEAAAKADPVLAALERRQERVGRLRSIITDRRRTSFVLVMLPERLVIDETARAAELLVTPASTWAAWSSIACCRTISKGSSSSRARRRSGPTWMRSSTASGGSPASSCASCRAMSTGRSRSP